jgi:hypothetical protein
MLILGREKLTWERKQSQRGRRGKFGEVRKQLLHWRIGHRPHRPRMGKGKGKEAKLNCKTLCCWPLSFDRDTRLK